MSRLLLLVPLLVAVACGGDGERPATWSYIHAAIIRPNCATSSCHSTLAKKKGLDFEDRDLALTNFIGNSALSVVQGIDPNAKQMPPDEPLPEADIELMERWVELGMMDD